MGPRTINFQVCLKDDQNKKGAAQLTIQGKALVTIKLSKSELKPLGDSDNKKADPHCVSNPKSDTCRRIIDFAKVDTSTLVLSVKDQLGKGIADYPLWIKTGVKDSSGGHDHTAGRPLGRLVTSGKDTVYSFHGKTDSTGICRFIYLCSGFGGYDSIYVEGLTKKDTASLTILVRISKFDSLESGAHYVLIGQYGTGNVSSKHRMNHFGSLKLIGKLKALADSLYVVRGHILRINDISIQFGGPFDISNDWNTPHQNHREGASVDIDDVDANDHVVDPEYLERIVTSRGFKGTFANEGNHFHISFR